MATTPIVFSWSSKCATSQLRTWVSVLAFVVAATTSAQDGAGEVWDFKLYPQISDLHAKDVTSFDWPGLASIDSEKIISRARVQLYEDQNLSPSAKLVVDYIGVSYEPYTLTFPKIIVGFQDVSLLAKGESLHRGVPYYIVSLPAQGSQLRPEGTTFIGGLNSTFGVFDRGDLKTDDVEPHLLENRLVTQWSSIERARLGKMFAILFGESFDRRWTERLEVVASDEAARTWIYAIPNDFVERLRVVTNQDARLIATTWMTDDSARARGWNEQSVGALLEQLSFLAKQVESDDQILAMWVSVK